MLVAVDDHPRLPDRERSTELQFDEPAGADRDRIGEPMARHAQHLFGERRSGLGNSEPGLGQTRPISAAVDQLQPQRVLEHVDAPRHGRDRHAARPRR